MAFAHRCTLKKHVKREHGLDLPSRRHSAAQVSLTDIALAVARETKDGGCRSEASGKPRGSETTLGSRSSSPSPTQDTRDVRKAGEAVAGPISSPSQLAKDQSCTVPFSSSGSATSPPSELSGNRPPVAEVGGGSRSLGVVVVGGRGDLRKGKPAASGWAGVLGGAGVARSRPAGAGLEGLALSRPRSNSL